MEEQVEQTKPQIAGIPQTVVRPENKIYKTLFFFLLGLILIGVLGYVGVTYFFSKTTPPLIIPPKQGIFTTAPEPPTAPGETTNWKTYTNTKYGFSFAFSPEWKLDYNFGGRIKPLTESEIASQSTVNLIPQKDNNNGKTVISIEANFGWPDPKSTVVRIIPITCEGSIMEDTCKNKIFPPNEVKVSKLNQSQREFLGRTAVEVTSSDNATGDYFYIRSVYFLRDKFVYRISLSAINSQNIAEHNRQFDQILSTFRFTN